MAKLVQRELPVIEVYKERLEPRVKREQKVQMARGGKLEKLVKRVNREILDLLVPK